MMRGWLALGCYVATIFAANWLLATFGVVTIIGLAIPAGVFAAAMAFPLRDAAHDALGVPWVLAGIAAGTILSALLSPQLALASGTAFFLSEMADFAVYAPLRRRGRWVLASVASNTVGGTVDSAVFLIIAFHSLAFLPGQLAGKWVVAGAVVAAVWCWRRWRARRERLAYGDTDEGYRAAIAATTTTGKAHVGVVNPDGTVTVRKVGG